MSRTARTRSSLAAILLAPSLLAGPFGAPEYPRGPAGASRPAASAHVEVLARNEDAWEVRWRVLEAARARIDATYFYVKDDAHGRAFLGKLLARADAGVRVRLMLDARGQGSRDDTPHASLLPEVLALHSNIEVRLYRDWGKVLRTLPLDLRHLAASNHDKILLVDGRVGIVGGRNIGSSYFTASRDDPAAFHDLELLVESREVGAALTRAFDREFGDLANRRLRPRPDRRHAALAEELRQAALVGDEAWRATVQAMDLDEDLDPDAVIDELLDREARVRVLDKGSIARGGDAITPALLAGIEEARRSIVIANPFFVLSREARVALARARARGVEVTVVTNGPRATRAAFPQAFFLREWRGILRDIPGIRLYMMAGERQLHSKVFLFDEDRAIVGTYNVDPMSQDINSEVMLEVRSASLAAELREVVEGYRAEAVRCRLRRDAAGKVLESLGPGDHLEGAIGVWVRALSHLWFLRPLI